MKDEGAHTFAVRPPTVEEIPFVQKVFNDRSIIADLGGARWPKT